MMVQECFPTLPLGSLRTALPRMLLKRSFPDPNSQREKLTPDALCTPEAGICRLKVIVSWERLGFLVCALDVCLQNKWKNSRCHRRSVSGRSSEESLFPKSTHPGEEHKKKSVRLSVPGMFHLSAEEDQLLSYERVFRHQFGLASGQIDTRIECKGGRWELHPWQNVFLKPMEAE